MKKLLPLVLLLTSTSAPAFAASAVDLINGKFDSGSRKERQDIARSVLAMTEKLSAFVSQLPPSEKSWVLDEQAEVRQLKDDAARNQRFAQLSQRPEFQQQELKSLLEAIKDSLQCIADVRVALRREMFCWAVASQRLSDSMTLNYAITNLVQHGRLPKDIHTKAELMPDSLGYGAHYTWYSRGIIEYIVIPYLAGQIKE
jgi:hypothetical protein